MTHSPTLRLAAAALLLLGSTACGISEGRFLDRYVETQCDYLFECYESEAESSFDSPKGCVDEYDDYTEDYADYYEDCEYSSSNARDCLKALRDLPCEPDLEDFDAIEDACSAVWVC